MDMRIYRVVCRENENKIFVVINGCLGKRLRSGVFKSQELTEFIFILTIFIEG